MISTEILVKEMYMYNHDDYIQQAVPVMEFIAYNPVTAKPTTLVKINGVTYLSHTQLLELTEYDEDRISKLHEEYAKNKLRKNAIIYRVTNPDTKEVTMYYHRDFCLDVILTLPSNRKKRNILGWLGR